MPILGTEHQGFSLVFDAGGAGAHAKRQAMPYTVLMDSIPITIYWRQNHRMNTYPAGLGGNIGIRRRNGEYRFVWCRGGINREDVPPGARPVKLWVTAWSWGEVFASERQYVSEGKHLVGILFDKHTYIVLYDGAPREI